MSAAAGLKRRFASAARSILRRFGLELYHHTDDPVLRSLMEARERLRVVSDPPAWVSDHLLARVAAQGHLRNLLRAYRIGRVVDVGANRGQFGALLRELGYRGRIVSFEPAGGAFEALQAACRADPSWQAERLALGEADEELAMNVYRSDEFSSLHEASARGRARFAEHLVLDHIERVRVRRLDDVLGDAIAAPQGEGLLLKTDTQGHDLSVMRGAPRTLAAAQVVMTEAPVSPIYEGVPTYRAILDFLGERGFRPSGLYPISHEMDLSLVELDCFFVKAPR